jgi:hypothetical protein
VWVATVAAAGAGAAIASASTVSWHCTVGPSGYCECINCGSHVYYFQVVTNTASFPVSVSSIFSLSGGMDAAYADGATCNSCVLTSVDAYINPDYGAHPTPEIYNWDPSNTRTFYVTDYY